MQIDYESFQAFLQAQEDKLYQDPPAPPVLEFLKERRFPLEIASNWKLGYCESDDPSLQLLNGRLIFPVHDWQGNVIQLIGRRVGNDRRISKFVNLTPNPIFDAKRHVYGLNRAIKSIAACETVIAVEGFTDVIGVFDLTGLANVVGLMGKHFAIGQAMMLARWAKTIVVMLDGDNHGRRAMAEIPRRLA